MWYACFSKLYPYSHVVHRSQYVATLENQSTRRTRKSWTCIAIECVMWVLHPTDRSAASQTYGNRFVNIQRRRVVELSSCRLQQQLPPMCQHGLPLRRATLKRHPMSGRDGRLETLAHLPVARLAPKSDQGRIRSRVRRRNPRYLMHQGLVRYLQLYTMNSCWMSTPSNETVLLDRWIIKAVHTTFVRSSSSRTCPIGANSSCCCWKT